MFKFRIKSNTILKLRMLNIASSDVNSVGFTWSAWRTWDRSWKRVSHAKCVRVDNPAFCCFVIWNASHSLSPWVVALTRSFDSHCQVCMFLYAPHLVLLFTDFKPSIKTPSLRVCIKVWIFCCIPADKRDQHENELSREAVQLL